MCTEKLTGITITIIITVLLFVSCLYGQTEESMATEDIITKDRGTDNLKPQTVCPLTGNEISKDAFVDYRGQRVYLCCMGCEARFLKSPEKALQKIKENGETVENLDPASVQPNCPVSGTIIIPALFMDYEIHRIYFCSDKCRKKFSKKPEKYLKKIKENKEE
jgi:YHS domain-containing protein